MKVDYEPDKFSVERSLSDSLPAEGEPGGPRVMSNRGDTESAFASARVQVDETYVTPVETHNPMEMHATVAVWDGKKYTLYESSQGVMNHQTVLSQVLGEPQENVEVISRFIGSGFGGKLFPWTHSAIAAAASRKLNRPVKFTLSRSMMFTNSGHRPNTQQRMRLGATPDGKLVSLQQDYRNHTNYGDDIRENCGEATPFLYSTANLKVTSALVRRNVGTPTPMRGPGAVPGLFALESAMDELAIKLKKDPVELRISLDTLIDEENNRPFSSRHLKECLQLGAEKFGWSRRTPEVGSMRKGDLILGWGVAAASWGANRGTCEATVSLRADGTARVSCGTQDIGTGSYTVIAQAPVPWRQPPIPKKSDRLGNAGLAAEDYTARCSCRDGPIRIPIATSMKFLKQIETLFRTGTAGGLTDGQLLERFLERRDEDAEAAFAALVDRHGAMVLRVCRQVLRDEDRRRRRRTGDVSRPGAAGRFDQPPRVGRLLAARRRRFGSRPRHEPPPPGAAHTSSEGAEMRTAGHVVDADLGAIENHDDWAKLHDELQHPARDRSASRWSSATSKA